MALYTPQFGYKNGNGTNNGRNEGRPRKDKAEMEAIRAKAKAMRDKRMEANREKDREGPNGMMAEIIAKMDANRAEMRSTDCTMRSELKRPSNLE
jgi:Spy/CpxP family protein refolding chaperone